jgi:hypothetical protein
MRSYLAVETTIRLKNKRTFDELLSILKQHFTELVDNPCQRNWLISRESQRTSFAIPSGNTNSAPSNSEWQQHVRSPTSIIRNRRRRRTDTINPRLTHVVQLRLSIDL